MTTRQHFCDFCRERVTDDCASGKVSGYGFRFCGAGSGEHLTEVPLAEAERHICQKCLTLFKRFRSM